MSGPEDLPASLLGGRVTLRRLPVVQGRPVAPITDGGRIVMETGEFAQIANGEEVRFVAWLEFKCRPGLSRGNHFHARKGETLYVVRGRLRARWADVDGEGRAEATLEAGDLVRVAPRVAHTYEALEDSQAIELSATPFDAGDVTPFAF